MIESASGLVLRTHPLTETSLIVHWLTADFGRLATVAKGARRAKSPFAGKLDLFYDADFSFVRSRRSTLHTLREVNLRHTCPRLRRDIEALQRACYCAALVMQTTESETPLPGIYELMAGWLQHLEGCAAPGTSVMAFELKLLKELGLAPDLGRTHLTGGSRAIVARWLEADWPEFASLRLSAAQMEELRQFLHGFLIYHLGRLPAGRLL